VAQGAKAMPRRIRGADFPVVAVAPPMRVIADPAPPDGYDGIVIVFDAGRRDAALVPATRDHLRIVEPRLVSIRE